MREVEPRIRTLPSNWQGAVLVCRKCSKKIGGGFGPKGKQSLAKALRKAKHSKKGRKGSFGVGEVPCLGVCPRDAVTVIDGALPGRWLVVPRGADVEAVFASLAYPQPQIACVERSRDTGRRGPDGVSTSLDISGYCQVGGDSA